MFVKRKLPSRNKNLDSDSGKFKPAIARGPLVPHDRLPRNTSLSPLTPATLSTIMTALSAVAGHTILSDEAN